MKNLTRTLSIILVAITLLLASVVAYSAWPASDGVDISQSLSSGYEPSGAVWHDELGLLIIVGDDGDVTKLEADGSRAVTYHPGGDLEGVTLVEDYVYVVVENPDTIKEFSLDTGSFTGKQWTLTSWLTGSSNLGAEAITWLPEEELFAVGLQADGKIYLFDVNLEVSEDVSFVEVIDTSVASDVSGLHYDPVTETMFVVYDSSNLLLEMQKGEAWEIVDSISLPGSNQEGVAVDVENGLMWVAEDSGDVISYTSYPFNVEVEEEVEDVDSDGDGLLDSEELELGSDAFDVDSDGDRLNDYDEVRVYGTDPLDVDSDGDSIIDWVELFRHDTDPLDADDRRAERVLDFEVDGGEVTIEYASGRTYTLEPFEGEDVEFAWLNKRNRALKVTDGHSVKRIVNGEVNKEWVPRYPERFLNRIMARYS